MSFPKKLFALDRAVFFIIAVIAVLALIFGCEKKENTAFAKAEKKLINTTENQFEKQSPRNLTQQWKDYWYAGTAEITSYKLEQVRYGEVREGTAALIFVTENFLPEKQVKADRQSENNISVLKLNATKKFNTGIYPYSVMTSTFYPVQYTNHAIKVSQSMQEWCGHVYAQINNKSNFEVTSHSYFQSEADQNFSLPKAVLENELWTQLRIDPEELPTGTFQAIPNLEYIRMKHVELKAYTATGNLRKDRYTIDYPALGRSLTIIFEPEFPYTINSWEETYKDGSSENPMTTRATKMETIKSAYWSKNSTADAHLRIELQLNP